MLQTVGHLFIFNTRPGSGSVNLLDFFFHGQGLRAMAGPQILINSNLNDLAQREAKTDI